MTQCGQVKEAGIGNRLRVVYLPPLSDMVGTRLEEKIVPRGATLAGLIDCLGRSHGPAFTGLFYREGRWDPRVGIFINGRPEHRPEKELPSGAEIALLPVVAGG
ncbi:MAG: MoaD/ThiS family protein [Desulfocucumaceae bacterium]